MEDTIIKGLRGAQENQRKFTLAICESCAAGDPGREEAIRSAKAALGAGRSGHVLVIDMAASSEGQVRQAFIGAVCCGASVLALGLEALEPQAQFAAVAGLASVQQWNPKARAVALCARDVPPRVAKDAWVARCPGRVPRGPR